MLITQQMLLALILRDDFLLILVSEPIQQFLSMFGKIKDKYKEKDWYADKYQSTLVQRNILAVVAIIALIISLIALSTVNRLAPLKTVRPFIVKVEEASGQTKVVDPSALQKYMADQLVAESNILQYIRARESYEPAITEYNYNQVRVMSHPQMFKSYDAFMRFSEDSPIQKLGVQGTRSVKILSISFLAPSTTSNLAQVRVQITQTLKNKTKVDNKIILIGFDYIPLDLEIEDRRLNPLGFTVSFYRLDDETLN